MSEQVSKIPTVFDSDEQQIGEIYATALLGAVTKDKIDQVVDEFESFVSGVLDKHPALDVAIANPKLSVESKNEMLDRIFKGKMDNTLLTFLKVLGRRQRLGSLRAIQKAASRLADETAGRVRAVVTVSDQLSADAQRTLTEKLSAIFKKEVRIAVKVDPNILGGLVVRIGDTVFDGSVDGQLKSLHKLVSQRAENAVRSIASSAGATS
ncbi:MAG: ATP synthase F1 subunit delta [Planctomycetaceae bacterium]|jgi:F-type H+-transporting ATPase subunit delta|nr:ATP synthase F1 subunit delta [Planctomycetaceae bacterium]MCE2813574.1 ATP synthase F1 subunit delta [Planctomycetaceae bacterium]